MKNVLMRTILMGGMVWLVSGAVVMAQPNILTNPDFEADPEGTIGGGTDVIDLTSITGWRAFGVGGVTGTATVTSAAGRSGMGIELVRTGPTGGDAAFDKDDPSLRETIPAEERIYMLNVDARDGGPFGGTPAMGLGIQFADIAFNRGTSFDPGADFETFGLTARSDTGGQVSTRFDVAGVPDRSVHLDNASLVDVTTGVNRVVNGGFENSDSNILNWRFFDVVAPSGAATLSGDANSGNHAALLEVTSEPLADIGLDIDPYRIPTIVGEESTLSLASKNVFADSNDTRLRVGVAGYDASGVYQGEILGESLNPGTSSYEDFSFEFIVPETVNFINVGFRIWDELFSTWGTGSYLIDDVSVMRMGTTLPADFDKDGDVDGDDFLIWQSGFGQFDPDTNPATMGDGDANMDGAVDGDDFLIWQAQFGSQGAGATAIPEPASGLLLAALGLILVTASRRKVADL